MSIFGKKDKQEVSLADKVAQYNAKHIAEQEALKASQAKPVQAPSPPIPTTFNEGKIDETVDFALNYLDGSDAENAAAAIELMKQTIPGFDENSPKGKKLMESLFSATNLTNERSEPEIETLSDIPLQFFDSAESFLKAYIFETVKDGELKSLLLAGYEGEEPSAEFLKVAGQFNKIFISLMTVEGYNHNCANKDTERLNNYITQNSFKNPHICTLMMEYPMFAINAIITVTVNSDETKFEAVKSFAMKNFPPFLESLTEHTTKTMQRLEELLEEESEDDQLDRFSFEERVNSACHEKHRAQFLTTYNDTVSSVEHLKALFEGDEAVEELLGDYQEFSKGMVQANAEDWHIAGAVCCASTQMKDEAIDYATAKLAKANKYQVVAFHIGTIFMWSVQKNDNIIEDLNELVNNRFVELINAKNGESDMLKTLRAFREKMK